MLVLVLAAAPAVLVRSQEINHDDLIAACDGGDVAACNSVGVYFERTSEPQDAFEYLRRACTGGFALGCSNIAEYFFDGRVVEQNYAAAFELFGMGCKEDIVGGCAVVCLVLNDLDRLKESDEPQCQLAVDAACGGGRNPWMCGREIAAASTPATLAAAGSGCQGQDLERTKNVVERMLAGASELAEQAIAGDLFGALNRLSALSQRAEAELASLPQACQTTVRDWMNVVSTTTGYDDFGTQCAGDVCCTSTECL